MHKFETVDAGPKAYVLVLRVEKDIVCAMTPASFQDQSSRDLARELVRSQGEDCFTCRACPLGRER